jgi:hypothetical protein
MAMIGTDFISEVRENIKRDTNGVSDVRILRWVNWAQGYLADLHSYEEMRYKDTSKVTNATDNSLTWPDRMKDLYSATVQDGARSQKLTYVLARDFDTIIPRPATYSKNIPTWYVDFGSTFELFPMPDAVYPVYIRISRYPTDIAAGTSSALLRKDALITAMATVFGFYSLREIEDAGYWGGEIVPALYEASLTGDHSAEDWVPIARGFGVSSATITGKWWLNPFTGRSVPGY